LPLIVFSHLRWNFVFQRPQHLLSRLAAQHPVIYIEEPECQAGATPHWSISQPQDGITVARPITPFAAGGYADEQMPALQTLVTELLRERQLADYIAWFYTPMALPLLDGLQPRAVVYDCMDELAAFKHAPPELVPRERQLLARADVVLTGGPSLYEAKRQHSSRAHCLPSSVDAAHYAPATVAADAASREAAERLQAGIGQPRLGFFGVVDERIDLGLIDSLAEARPDWSLVIVGPVVKIDPATLPRRPNIHWLGQQDYRLLPALVASWDVCLMPFALNEHTRFISPTKTLEYLAADKPVVSTRVNDVVAMYAEVVSLAESPQAFLAACEALLRETQDEAAERLQRSRACVARYSWDASAEQVRGWLREAMRPVIAANDEAAVTGT
jgi:glycosyltransferase involved in cell wall biosynthesis